MTRLRLDHQKFSVTEKQNRLTSHRLRSWKKEDRETGHVKWTGRRGARSYGSKKAAKAEELIAAREGSERDSDTVSPRGPASGEPCPRRWARHMFRAKLPLTRNHLRDKT